MILGIGYRVRSPRGIQFRKYASTVLKNYIDYYNTKRIKLKLKGMSPVEYRTHSQKVA